MGAAGDFYPLGVAAASRPPHGLNTLRIGHREASEPLPSVPRSDIPFPGDERRNRMAANSPTMGAPDLGHYLRPLRRHRGLILLCVLIGLIFGTAYAAVLHPAYTSVTKVLVQTDFTDTNANVTGGRTTSSALNMDTETQILKSIEVAIRAQAILHTTTSPSALLSKVTVSVPPNTSVLKIAFKAHSTAAANAGAKAFAEAYLENRAATSQAFLNREISAARKQVNSDRRSLVAATRRVDSLATGSPAKQDALAEQSTDQATVTHDSTILSGYTSTVLHPGRIASPAGPGGSSPNRTRIIAILTGLVVGLLVGFIAAFIRERMAKRIRSMDDLERMGVPVIAEVIVPARREGGGRKERANRDASAQLRAEQRVAAAVGRGLSERGGSIYVAALSPRAVEHRIGERLANEMARFGSTTEVILYDSTAAELEQSILVNESTDPEPFPVRTEPVREESIRPEPVDAQPVDAEPVRTEAGLGWPSASPSLATTTQPAPSLVRAVPEAVVEPAEPGELARIDHRPPPILRRVRLALGRARYVVLEGTDALADSEPYILGSLTDVTLLVVEAGVTTRAQVSDVIEQVEVTPSELIGALLWRAPSASKRTTEPTRRKTSNVSVARDTEPTSGSSRAR
jgi:capsular polysaccharide biosynthesis protein